MKSDAIKGFYDIELTPILQVKQLEKDKHSIFVYRPSDVLEHGLAKMALLDRLPEELQQSDEIIVTLNKLHIPEPANNEIIQHMVSAL